VNTGRPPDFDVGRGRGTEAEVQAFVIRGEIAPGGSCKPDLTIHLNAVPKPSRLLRLPRRVMVSQGEFPRGSGNLWTITERSGDDVDPTIVVQIAEGCTASGNRHIGAGVRLFEVSVVIHGEQGGSL